jgi:outer membrane protein TolC
MLLALLLLAPLSLQELQDRARKNDPRAQQAVAQMENAQGKKSEADWSWFPIFATTAYFGGPTSEHKLLGGDQDPNPADPSHLTPGSLTGGLVHGEWGYVAHIDVQGILPLWTFGKISAGKEAGKHYVYATEALLQRAKDQAAFDVARAYWGWQTARDADASAQKIRDKLTDAQKTTAQLLAERSPQVRKSDSLKLDYLAEEIETAHAKAAKNRDLAMTALRLLTGTPPDQQLEIVQQALPDPPDVPNADEVLRKALDRRPETHAAREGVAARSALVDLARARLYPDIGLAFGARFTDTSNASNPSDPFITNPYHESSGYIVLGLQGTFDVPQKLARLRQAEADLREAIAVQVGAEQLVRLEVQQAMGDLIEAGLRWKRYSNQTTIGRQLATQSSVAFDTGLGEARDLLEDTLLYARADGERLSALFDAQVAWAALEKATGGPLK